MLRVRWLGTSPMREVWSRMQAFTDSRTPTTPDEVWLVEHPPVFTLGLSGNEAHLLDPGAIEVVKTDRGGQVTYHGPGQLVAYVLLDLKRAKLDIRTLVTTLEEAVIASFAGHGIEARGRRDAPGVYVGDKKLAAIGLRVRRGCSYHGIAVNVAMDLEPFSRINPCGFEGLEVTQLAALCEIDSVDRYRPALERALRERLEAVVSGS